MAGFHHKFDIETIKDVDIFLENGNLYLRKVKVVYRIHANGSATHDEPVVVVEEVPLQGYGHTCWDFAPAHATHPDRPNFYSK